MDLNIFRSKSKVIINGKTYDHGKNVSITNGKVVIDGVVQEDNILAAGPISVLIQGTCGNIECASGEVIVSGSVDGDVSTASGDIDCGDVQGSISTASGDVQCGNVGGRITTASGDIYKN